MEVYCNGALTALVDVDKVKWAVGHAFNSYIFAGDAVLMGGFRLWAWLGFDFRLGRRMLERVIGWCWDGIWMFGRSIEFLLNQGCLVSTTHGENPLRDRLANLCLIPILLRARRPKRLPAVLVRMVKEMLTGVK